MPDAGAETELNAFLAQVFACPAETAEAIGRRATPRAHAAQAVVIRQGDAVAEAYLLWLGRARAVAYTREGGAVQLQEFLPGDLFGALGDHQAEPSDHEVVTVEPSRMAVFAGPEFLSLAERHSCIGLALSRTLLRQLRAATQRMVARTTLTSVGRIHAELLRLADVGDGRVIRPAPVLAVLAQRVQTTRETASRAVNALERRGIVRREADALVIVARRRLEELVV